MPRSFTVRACCLGILTCCLGIVVAFGAAAAQEEPSRAEVTWALLHQLVGRWEGAIDGRLGTGTGVRDYERILDGNFLLFRHTSVRLPQEKSPEGDHHRELGVFSFDTERDRLVFREFMIEGVVDRYVCDVEGRRVRCVTEHVESGPGIRARLTLDIHDAYVFDETFELAFPGDELSVYFTNRWTRVPALE